MCLLFPKTATGRVVQTVAIKKTGDAADSEQLLLREKFDSYLDIQLETKW